MNLLARARKICLSLPEAYEKTAWGAPTFRVRDRMFAMYSDNHHGDGRIALWCQPGHRRQTPGSRERRPKDGVIAPSGAQEILVAADPRHFFIPPYVGTEGWLGIRLDKGLNWGVVAGLVKDGYLEAAARRSASRRAAPDGVPAAARRKRARPPVIRSARKSPGIR